MSPMRGGRACRRLAGPLESGWPGPGRFPRDVMKTLLTSTAVIEASAGVGLLVRPSSAIALIFGSAAETPVGLEIGRIAGVALLALGFACWRARHDASSPAGTGLIAAMWLYNVAAVAILLQSGLVAGLSGIGLRPGVILHVAMAVWCTASLRSRTPPRSDAT